MFCNGCFGTRGYSVVLESYMMLHGFILIWELGIGELGVNSFCEWEGVF